MTKDSRDKALEKAANVLSYRNQSASALYERLLEKEVASDDARYAVDRLKELGLLNDDRYAESLVERGRAAGHGAMRIRQELRRKGLEQETIELSLEAFEPDHNEMRKIISKAIKGGSPDRKALKKASDSLLRRGFSWEQVNAALREYIDQLEDELE